ncbi:MAG: ABC transporter permease [Blastocatellales bacterium]
MPDWVKRFLPFISLIVLVITIPLAEYFVLGQDPKFLTSGNLAAIARQTAVITIMAMGMTMVMVSGGIDLSVGSIIGLTGVVGSMAMVSGGLPSIAGFLVCIIVGAVCGMVNGSAITALKIPAFIVTLGAMGIYRGLGLYLCDGNAVVGLPMSAGYLAEKNLLGIPLPLLLVVAIALMVHFVLSSTRLGRYCYAMGSNIEAARYAGIPVARYQITYFTILGALSGLAGAIETSRTVTGQPNAGEGYELNVIAAVVIGGGSLSGGQGTVVGTIIGSLIMGVLANGGNLLQISPFIQKIVIGAVIVLAVTFDEFQRRRVETTEA